MGKNSKSLSYAFYKGLGKEAPKPLSDVISSLYDLSIKGMPLDGTIQCDPYEGHLHIYARGSSIDLQDNRDDTLSVKVEGYWRIRKLGLTSQKNTPEEAAEKLGSFLKALNQLTYPPQSSP